MKVIAGLIVGFLGGLATMFSDVERIGATWSPALDAVCGLFLDIDVYKSKPEGLCGLSKTWKYHLKFDEVKEKKSDVVFLGYGDQCYSTDDCSPDMTEFKVKRCWSLDGLIKDDSRSEDLEIGKQSGRFCLARDQNCPFPGISGLEPNKTFKWGGNNYRCLAETDGNVVRRYYIEIYQ